MVGYVVRGCVFYFGEMFCGGMVFFLLGIGVGVYCL